jgi:hypothetical protein
MNFRPQAPRHDKAGTAKRTKKKKKKKKKKKEGAKLVT